VLDTIGARDVEVDSGLRDELAEAFFHLARVEEQDGARDRHGRFTAASSSLDPLDPPLERLRARLGIEPPRWRGARFAVALTHDVDVPWRWTRAGIRAAAGRLRRGDLREAVGLAAVPLHRLRGSDPNWSFERIIELERAHDARSTFFLLAAHAHPADGPVPESYDRLRPRLVETIAGGGGEIGLHGSYTAADDASRLAAEKSALEQLAGPVAGQRYHYLRADPHANLAAVEAAGFLYDSSLGFSDALGFRAGIAHPFRPWGTRLVEIPLAAMDVTLGEERYLGLSASESERRLLALLDWAAEHGGGFAILWHTDRFDRWTARGWDRLYERVLAAVAERGGVCLTAGELAEEADAWLP
jgi:peptidoglycan/xylan/chitin deacetylase (PgdA/CDA1 family)